MVSVCVPIEISQFHRIESQVDDREPHSMSTCHFIISIRRHRRELTEVFVCVRWLCMATRLTERRTKTPTTIGCHKQNGKTFSQFNSPRLSKLLSCSIFSASWRQSRLAVLLFSLRKQCWLTEYGMNVEPAQTILFSQQQWDYATFISIVCNFTGFFFGFCARQRHW